MKKTTLNNLEYLDISQTVNQLEIPRTPFLSYLLGAGKTKPTTSTEYKWRESELDGADSSGQLEGGDFTDAETGRIWNSNVTEIFRKSTSVSGTLDAINVHGVGNELTNQVAQRSVEMKRDLNRQLIVGVKSDETASTGRRMNGVMNLINSGNIVTTATAGKIVRADIDAAFRVMWDKGYSGDKLFLASPDMADLMTNDAEEKSQKIATWGDKFTYGLRLGNLVSNWGQGSILVDPDVPAGTMIGLDVGYVNLRQLREWQARELPLDKDAKRIGLVGEYGVEYTASNSGVILKLNP